ncbi:MAG TPA: LTA synthase family protein [Bacillota bacterium]|nr:LTA synthase family protein [Bacillota bacterium]
MKIVSFFAVSVMLFAILWAALTYDHVSLSEIIFHLHVPMTGTDKNLTLKGILSTFIPAVGVTLLFAFLILPRRGRTDAHKRRWYEWRGKPWMARALTMAVIAGLLFLLHFNLHFLNYITSQFNYSSFIESHYADPNCVNLKAPEKKRNLIFIYMESMEATYADIESGGMMPENRIPHLTDMAKNNLCFSHHDQAVGGFRNSIGTSWTVGGAFGSMSGLPLCIPVSQKVTAKLESFFPGVTALGDILERDGYRNVLLADNKTEFGGQKLLFQKHGNYEILDYDWAHENGKIPKGYFTFWGFEDYRLYEIAREKLTALAESDRPFNLTLFTLDTHFEDGLLCPKCRHDFDDQYSRVIACADRQVYDFVQWIQQQDFYKDTTIVIVGDHLTMDKDYCKDIEREDRAVYNCLINSVVQAERKNNREFMIIDMFPTTLAALGYTFDGNRLGLGTNLFSSGETLCEQYGTAEVDKQFSYRSGFYERELLYGLRTAPTTD